jgi:CheY-like chemotaxis protein/HPt (histidine-containing phosphotransfer) domain-containing protein
MLEGTHILIVEDNLVSQRVTQRLVRKLGYESKVVGNGQEAVDAFKNKKFDLILMDCQMPIMDGYAASREIRKIESQQGGHIPIVAVTAHTLEGNRERCFESGMDDYITKPVKLEDLKSTIESAFANLFQNGAPDQSRGTTEFKSESEGAQRSANIEANPLANEKPALDPKALDQIRGLDLGGDVHPLVELADLFIEDVPMRFERLRTGIDSLNTQQVEESAHGILGSSGNMGAVGMTAQCIQIKENAKIQNWEVVQSSFAALIQEFERVKIALEAEKQKLQS